MLTCRADDLPTSGGWSATWWDHVSPFSPTEAAFDYQGVPLVMTRLKRNELQFFHGIYTHRPAVLVRSQTRIYSNYWRYSLKATFCRPFALTKTRGYTNIGHNKRQVTGLGFFWLACGLTLEHWHALGFRGTGVGATKDCSSALLAWLLPPAPRS